MIELVTLTSSTIFASGNGASTVFQITDGATMVLTPVKPVFYLDGSVIPAGSYTVSPMGILTLADAPAQGVALAWSGQYVRATAGSFDVPGPLQKIIPAYLYQQYFDDESLSAFFQTLNQKMQGYADWFNGTPLGVYTADSISGPLLDWVGLGLYGIVRPVISNVVEITDGAYNTDASYTDELPYNDIKTGSSGRAYVASDDIYKRVLTWYQYAGDGRQASIMWLRRRVARFIYGTNGTDVPNDALATISITNSTSYPPGAFGTNKYNNGPPYNDVDDDYERETLAHALTIIVPDMVISTVFAALVAGGILALPFQMKFTVLISH